MQGKVPIALLPELMSLALFGEKADHSRLEFFMRFFASRDKSGLMREGDWRNGEEIRKWVNTLIARTD